MILCIGSDLRSCWVRCQWAMSRHFLIGIGDHAAIALGQCRLDGCVGELHGVPDVARPLALRLYRVVDGECEAVRTWQFLETRQYVK